MVVVSRSSLFAGVEEEPVLPPVWGEVDGHDFFDMSFVLPPSHPQCLLSCQKSRNLDLPRPALLVAAIQK